MPRPYASILGTGRYLPPQVVSNADLAKRVDTSDEWIVSRTGIKERRLAGEGAGTSFMATEAGKRAIEKAGLKPADIDAVIVATLSPDYPWPATACLVQNALGAPQALAFDISAACSGFVYAMSVAEGMIAAGSVKHVLVIGAEKLSGIMDWQDRNTCVLFGDGAGAVVMGPANGQGELLSFTLGADGSQVERLYQPAGGTACPASIDTVTQRLHFLKMDGKEVFKFAVRIMGDASTKALELAGLTPQDISVFIPHQANIRIIESAAKHMGLGMDKVFVNLDRYGNTSAASVGIALDEAIEQGRLKRGDKTVLVAFGAGLTWAACSLRW